MLTVSCPYCREMLQIPATARTVSTPCCYCGFSFALDTSTGDIFPHPAQPQQYALPLAQVPVQLLQPLASTPASTFSTGIPTPTASQVSPPYATSPSTNPLHFSDLSAPCYPQPLPFGVSQPGWPIATRPFESMGTHPAGATVAPALQIQYAGSPPFPSNPASAYFAADDTSYGYLDYAGTPRPFSVPQVYPSSHAPPSSQFDSKGGLSGAAPATHVYHPYRSPVAQHQAPTQSIFHGGPLQSSSFDSYDTSSRAKRSCRCGSTAHQRTNHHTCPLNGENRDKYILLSPAERAASLAIQAAPGTSSAPSNTSLDSPPRAELSKSSKSPPSVV